MGPTVLNANGANQTKLGESLLMPRGMLSQRAVNNFFGTDARDASSGFPSVSPKKMKKTSDVHRLRPRQDATVISFVRFAQFAKFVPFAFKKVLESSH